MLVIYNQIAIHLHTIFIQNLFKMTLTKILKMVGFNASKNETRSQTYNRLYRTDCALKQSSIKKQQRAVDMLKLNFYKREIELVDNKKTKTVYKHKSLAELMKRYTLKQND